jgi:hypothetical protein
MGQQYTSKRRFVPVQVSCGDEGDDTTKHEGGVGGPDGRAILPATRNFAFFGGRDPP